ncbi:GumC family protein [Salinimicrobium sp. TH3]|uniref:GumC family protein n=1 Tax=Salinimicrobium sp. TH3 TaxID=2997342 RepID=UPI002273C68E|nr:tyrosine-protein kinase family protein [Salinimicrobium sp. TH3]MCY2687553.1 polysaccharide biosynthesis tyrosine autokinase [Salinimicrobium sp. TH3]
MTGTNNFSNRPRSEKLNLKKELVKYFHYWPWFLLSLTVFLSLGFLYLRYTTPVYSAKASIIIKDKSVDSGVGEAIYSELGIGGMGANNFDTEIGILKSRRLMAEVVKSLNIQYQYFKEGKFRTIEIYDNIPFSMQVLRMDEARLQELGGASFKITQKGSDFIISDLEGIKSIKVKSGTPVKLEFADIVLGATSLPKYEGLSDQTIITFSTIEKVAAHYRNSINLVQEAKSSGLMNLELQDPVRQKARDILDQLILEYNRDAIEDRNLIAGNTANFINERLSIINGELDSVETGKETFKEENLLTDIQAQSQLFIQNANEYNKRRQEIGTQLELAGAMLEYIGSNSKSDLLPTNLGISEMGVNQQINEYNDLVLERNRILGGSSEKNPMVIRLNNNIEQIKNNVVQSLRTMHSNLEISQEELRRQSSSIGSQIYAVPSKERAYRGIERQQNIKETLYLFLLQKREENSLSLAVTEPKAKIVDRAYFTDYPVAPSARNIYLGTFILGLFLPFSVLYVKEMFNDKVKSKSDIEGFSKEIPVVGMIPKIKRKRDGLIRGKDRSVLAESFRILITNLQYLLINVKEKTGGIVLFVTSTTKGEGKTFTSVNLAITLANSGKKVLLLGGDLRNPKLQAYKANSDNLLGLSDYLLNDNLCLRFLLGPSNLHKDIDVLTSGSIPPNPYELLKQEKMAKVFKDLEMRYDFIVVDTAPAMPVADTSLLTKYADAVLFIVRSGFTEKDLLEFPLDCLKEGKFNNISFVLNDLKPTHLGYGSKYGYGYVQDKKSSWLKRSRDPEPIYY